MRKVYNFSAGPAMLPEPVMLQAQEEFLDWQGSGMSAMEVSHRGPDFQKVIDQSEADIRELLSIPKDYHVLFLAGGATHQFAMVPLNLLNANLMADYVNTGSWSKKAIGEAKRYGKINIAASTTMQHERVTVIKEDQWTLNPAASYLHFTPNETIEGIEFHQVPDTRGVPLVADMSSTFLSRPIDVTRYGLIYAGAQKNLGQAGITVVIIHRDLVKDPITTIPTLYQYKTQVENQSLYNTPPTYSWYITSLVLAWIKREGGLKVMAERNQGKSDKLYRYIDHSNFYTNKVDPEYRSWMNIPFTLKDNALDAKFLTESKQAGLTYLIGHKLVGGMRASIYNAMPESGVDALISFMQDFAKRNI